MEIYIYDKASLARPDSQLQGGTSGLGLPASLPALPALPACPFKMRRFHCLPKGFVGKIHFSSFFPSLFSLSLSLLFYSFFSLLIFVQLMKFILLVHLT